MTKMYEIKTLQDITELTPEQQSNFFQDFAEWLNYINTLKVPKGFEIDKTKMIWHDDGDYGTMRDGFIMEVK